MFRSPLLQDLAGQPVLTRAILTDRLEGHLTSATARTESGPVPEAGHA